MFNNVTLAQEALDNPQASGLNDILASSETPQFAKGALAALTNGNGSTSTDTARLQVIDEDQKFTHHLSQQIEGWKLFNKGFNYDVVAVFGSQSTGKSTLLNRLFGTSFDVMNETQRQQTTKGIWMCKGKDMDVLVMDVEGTDGRERGEDQDFERKAALFSMAASEVIIVNMWEHQVGLYQGANMGLLKTVFEVNLALFQAAKGKRKANATQDKTHLLFVIRDHIGATPLSNLRTTLLADLNRIWDGLSKPDGTEQSQITDYFDLSFTALSHKLLQPDNFDRDVSKLRKRFSDRSDPEYVFKPAYHKRIPADGLAPYMEGIWEAVVTNKDLDLPTQQELLAQFRCDEIASTAFVKFEAAIGPLRRPVETGAIVNGLGKSMGTSRAECLSLFDEAASRYHQGVYDRKKAELFAKMNSILSVLFVGQLKNLAKNVVKQFQSTLLTQLKGEGYDFAEVVKDSREESEKIFVDGANEILLPETDWSYQETFNHLDEDLTAVADQCRVEETKKMIVAIERNLKKEVGEPVELALNKPSPVMWDKVLVAFNNALSKAEDIYRRKAKSFNSTAEEVEEGIKALKMKSWLALKAKVDEQTTDSLMLVRLKLAFEDRFRYDKEGVPRVWKPEDDIDGIFRVARDETLGLIPLFSRIKASETSNITLSIPSGPHPSTGLGEPDLDFESSLIVLSDTKQEQLSSSFRRESDAYYLEAKRSIVSSIAQIPYWMYGVVGILGWNEFVAVLRSPVYFVTLLVMLLATYIIFQLNLGPVLSIGRGVYNETFRVANEKLTEYFNDPTRSQPIPVEVNRSRDSADKEEIELTDRRKKE